MSHRNAIRAHYEPRIAPTRESFDVLDWADADSQQMRFEVLLDNVPLAGRTLLDIGCGLGDLWALLRQRGLDVDYTGVDLLDKMIQEARRRHPQATFLCGDVFAEPAAPVDRPEPARMAQPAKPAGLAASARPQPGVNPLAGRQFDVVFCSGVFNLNLGNNREFLPRAVHRMFELARGHVVFNMLHYRTAARYAHCVYYDPREVLQMLHPMPADVRIIDHYLDNDFTVVCTLAADFPLDAPS